MESWGKLERQDPITKVVEPWNRSLSKPRITSNLNCKSLRRTLTGRYIQRSRFLGNSVVADFRSLDSIPPVHSINNPLFVARIGRCKLETNSANFQVVSVDDARSKNISLPQTSLLSAFETGHRSNYEFSLN